MLSPPRWSWECWAICLSLRPWLHSSVNSVSPKQANEGGLHKVRDGCWIISPQSNNMCNFGTLEGSGPSNLSSQTHFSQSSMTQLRFRHTGLLQHCLKSLTERWWPSAAQSCLLRFRRKGRGNSPDTQAVYDCLFTGIYRAVLNLYLNIKQSPTF